MIKVIFIIVIICAIWYVCRKDKWVEEPEESEKKVIIRPKPMMTITDEYVRVENIDG